MAIVYVHKRLDNNEVFYVGIGKTNQRAKSKDKRSRFWKNFTELHEYLYEIVFNDISWEEACQIEIKLISLYGRRDIGTGTLVNMTNGGQGGATTTGRKRPDLSERNRTSKNMLGVSLRWINKDGKNKRVKDEYLPEYLKNGWVLGSLKHGPCDLRKGKSPWNKGLSGYRNIKISSPKSN